MLSMPANSGKCQSTIHFLGTYVAKCTDWHLNLNFEKLGMTLQNYQSKQLVQMIPQTNPMTYIAYIANAVCHRRG